jgi:Zn finger protein HypA/HybF involved in hydrogenase expression
MPFGTVWKCNHCNNSLRTSGLWEFYIDEFGLRQKYGHPFPTSRAAKNAGVQGFSVQWYCSRCRSVRDVSVLEFDKAQPGSLGALGAYMFTNLPYEEFEAICDKCGAKLKDDIEGELCPKCNAGHFQEQARFMS